MLRKITFAKLGLGGLALASALSMACVADRPSRNGVFDENQYLRKDFLITSGNGGVDEGWFAKATVVATSTPNPLANVAGAGLYAGAEGYTANLVRFVVTQDQLSMVDMRELSNDPNWNAQGSRVPAAVNAWPITNVDLKYQVNLDGEKTNFYQENQELDWQVRQWVKINFAKNNLSDLYPFDDENNGVMQKCIDLVNTAVTLHSNSFNVDEASGYFEFTLDFTIPIAIPAPSSADVAAGTTTDADTCLAAFGSSWQTFQALGRSTVNLSVKYSFVRPSKVTDGSYVPMPIAEKDPIQHKYGAFELSVPYRDTSSGLLGADTYVVRHDPNKDIVYYFAPGMPKNYQQFFVSTLQPQTNAALQKAGTKGKLVFLNYNDASKYGDAQGPNREVGDARYSFVVWHSDLDNGSGLLGVAPSFVDPRTGENISSTVNVYEGPFPDTVQQRLEAFLETVGAEYLTPSGDFNDSAMVNGQPAYPPNCKDGDMVPLVPADVSNQLNRQSTVYSKMQQYLQEPFAQYGYLGPSNFLPLSHDQDFYNAYFAVMPYQIYNDPAANMFVYPQAKALSTAQTMRWQSLQQVAAFQSMAAAVDNGTYKPTWNSPVEATNFASNWQSLGRAVTKWGHTQAYLPGMAQADDISLFDYFDIYQRDGRHCVNGKWESRADYTKNLIQSLNEAVATHEFGHTMGLRHNFMGSVDEGNFPLDKNGRPLIYSSSIMDYNQPIVEAFYESNAGSPVWGPYDTAAMAWIYGNDHSSKSQVALQPGWTPGTAISGQKSATAPWNDPLGFSGNTENQFLYCSDEHTLYTPLCQQYDMGVTPAEIVANAIQQREWNYLWTNFRLYHKYYSFQNYASNTVAFFQGLRRFQSAWLFDWSQGEMTNTLRLAGVPTPMGDTAADYYEQLYNKFESDMSVANRLAVAYMRAVTDQSSGERPYKTVYDSFYGDVTQQGIQIDKVELTTGITGLWPAGSNFDPSQAAGIYVATLGGIGDAAFRSVADSALNDFLGAAFATYAYAQLGPLAVWSQTTHDPAFGGDLTYQNWTGSWTFDRDIDFLRFVRAIAVQYGYQNCDENGVNCNPCVNVDTCTWDPRVRQQKITELNQSDYVNRFQGPDGKSYIWGWLESRNQWVLAEKDRNTATYTLMYNWQTDVVYGQDTGENGASYLEYPVRFAVDAFQYFDDMLPGSNNGVGTSGGNSGGG